MSEVAKHLWEAQKSTNVLEPSVKVESIRLRIKEIQHEKNRMKCHSKVLEEELKRLRADCDHDYVFRDVLFDPCQRLEEWQCTVCKNVIIK